MKRGIRAFAVIACVNCLLMSGASVIADEPSHVIFRMAELKEKQVNAGDPWLEFLNVPALMAGLYELPVGAEDHQTPHPRDEIYYVVSGRAEIIVDGERRAIGPGDVIYVRRDAKHRFEKINDDLSLLVIFAPGGEWED